MKPDDVKQAVADTIAAQYSIDADISLKLFTVPKDRAFGDLSLPCFFLAKELKCSPAKVASELAQHLAEKHHLDTSTSTGPYLNIVLPRDDRIATVLETIRAAGDRYGSTDTAAGTVVIDYSSPNIAKPFGIGHLRSTIIGNALARIWAFRGYRVVRVNHLGDWGKQYGLLDIAFDRWGSEDELRRDPIRHMYELYVRVNRLVEEGDTALDEAGREAFRQLEQGDPRRRERWQRFRDLSIEDFKRIYQRLDVDFDSYSGESFFEDKMAGTIANLEARGLLKESQGARVVDLEAEGLGQAIIVKSNGSTTYLTRDLATAEYRHATYAFDRMIYVVGQPQELHFRQLFAILGKMGYEWSARCEHVMFGYIRGMSTRKGTIVFLEDVLDEARERVRKKMDELMVQKVIADGTDRVAEEIGITAVLFSDLKNRRIKDIEFDWDRILSLQGDTGPYLQNALARIYGVFRNTDLTLGTDPPYYTCLDQPLAVDMINELEAFPAAVEDAYRFNEPSIISSYLLGLSKRFHAAYSELRVKGSTADVARARLVLFDCVRQVFVNGFRLLGFRILEEM